MVNLYTTREGYNVAVIDNNPRPPTKETTVKWFRKELKENIDNPKLMDEFITAIHMGHLNQKDVDNLIEEAVLARAKAVYDNITRLLAGKTSNMEYNYGSGEYEQKPPLGWGQ